MIRAEMSGEPAPELVIQRTVLEIAPNAYRVVFDGRAVDAGACEISSAGPERQLVMRGGAGTNAGRVIRGIFQLVGDRLRICYGLDAQIPDSFTTVPGDARYLATYRRLA